MRLDAALSGARERLAAAGIAEPAREAASLLAFTLEKDRSFLFAHPEYELSADAASNFTNIVARREQREPFQYITGRQEFYGLDFRVTPDVLIPRPETEILVEAAINRLLPLSNPRFCEVGVGSGCISVSILNAVPAAAGVGLEISQAAIEVAAANAERLGVGDRLELRLSDVFAALRTDERFDLIAANPPYVPAAEIAGLQAEVGRFEPHSALTDGADGLSVIRRIINEAPGHLSCGGWLLVEIGAGQAEDVAAMLQKGLWDSIEFLPDLQSIPRTLSARLSAR